jgi:hypothetical protein
VLSDVEIARHAQQGIVGADQRGLDRYVVGDVSAIAGNASRADIGAYESQGVPSFPAGDYNHNGIADAADYVVWRKIDGTPAGYNLWRTNFGNTTVPVTSAGSGAGNGAASDVEASVRSDAASSAVAPGAAADIEPGFAHRFAPSAYSAPTIRHGPYVPKYRFPSVLSDNRMLLALDQAMEELDHDRGRSRWQAEADDAHGEKEEHAYSDDLLALTLTDWR